MAALDVWPTDASDGSVATEARWRKMARLWAPSAVVKGAGGELAPTLAMPNLTVQSGACWVDGHYCELAASTILAVTADGLAVVRFDPAANSAELVWRAGVTTPTQIPDGVWELPIYKTVASVGTDLRQVVAAVIPPPAATPNPGWSVTAGYIPDKILNPETTTVTELARVVGTLIDTLKTDGTLGPP
jgi:hypothetical protein